MKRSPTGEIDAVKSLDSLNKIYSENTGILFFKAFILAECGKNDEALPIVEHLTKVQPDSADNWIMKGQVLQAMDKSQYAATAFDKAIKLHPAHTDVYGMKAAALIKLGKLDEALSTANKAIELSPGDANAIYKTASTERSELSEANPLIEFINRFISGLIYLVFRSPEIIKLSPVAPRLFYVFSEPYPLKIYFLQI